MLRRRPKPRKARCDHCGQEAIHVQPKVVLDGGEKRIRRMCAMCRHSWNLVDRGRKRVLADLAPEIRAAIQREAARAATSPAR